MEQANKRPDGKGSAASDGNTSLVIPPEDMVFMLYLRLHRLADSGHAAVEAGDAATAARLTAETRELVQEIHEVVERMQAQ